jgi:hypothetical protein
VVFGFFLTLFFCSQALHIFSGGTLTLIGKMKILVSSLTGLVGAVLLKGAEAIALPFVVLLVFSLVEASKLTTGSGIQLAFATVRFAVQRYGVLLAAFIASCGTLGAWFWSDAFYLLATSFSELPPEGISAETAAGFYFKVVAVVCACARLLVPWVGVADSVSQRQPAAVNASSDSSELTTTRRWLLISCIVTMLFAFLFSRLPTFCALWPALALLAALGGQLQSAHVYPRIAAVSRTLFAILPFVLPVILLSLAVLSLLWQPVFSGVFLLSERINAITAAFLDEKYLLALGLFLAAVILFAAALVFKSWVAQTYRRGYSDGLYSLGIARSLALLQLLACTVLMVVVVPIAEEALTMPLQQSTAKARMFLGVNQKLATAGIFSPTVVSSNNEVVLMGSAKGDETFTNPEVNVVLTTVWNLAACEKYGFDVAQAIAYLRICLRSYQRTLEGSQPLTK